MNLLLLKTSFATYLIGLAMVFVASCEEEDVKPSKRDILVDKSWQVVNYEMNDRDITKDWDNCKKDDVTIFATNGTYLYDINDIKCEENETNYNGSWKFKANESILTISPSSTWSSDWDILELTDTSFKITQYDNSIRMKIIITMIPK